MTESKRVTMMNPKLLLGLALVLSGGISVAPTG
jgi:hypothetical protein